MNIPFLWVQITALVCYLLLLVSLLPAQNKQVSAFSGLLACFVLWTGGSLLMRLQVWPGYRLWYMVSLLSLFCIPAMLYHFVYEFSAADAAKEKWLVRGLTALLVIPSAFDLYVKTPMPELLPGGATVYRYHVDAWVLAPTLLCAAILLLVVRRLWRHTREPEFRLVIWGMALLAVGNLASILPGNVFPFDTLAGILNAGLLCVTLYRRRLFRLRVFVAPGTVMLLAVLFVSLLAVPASGRVAPFLALLLGERYIRALPAAFWCASAVTTAVVYRVLRWVVRQFVLGDEKQRGLALQQFSAATARNPSRQELQRELLDTLERTFGGCEACIFLLDEAAGAFVPTWPESLAQEVRPIRKKDPCAAWFARQQGCVRTRQVRAAGLEVAQDKLEMMQRHRISCIVPFQDEKSLQGILFLQRKSPRQDYTADELTFLASLGSMVSVGLKNAGLYTQLYQEAREDQLTGLLNRRAFTEALEHQCAVGAAFALVMLDLDDFKLYNQLYGMQEGDRALVKTAGLLRRSAGAEAILARYAGKVFMALLPEASGAEGLEFARRVSRASAALTNEKLCRITFSSGVYGYTGGGETARHMLECVDVVVFEIKQTGKNDARLYSGRRPQAGGAAADVSYASTVYAITAAIDAKDHYTFNHSQNVANYARQLARAIGLDESHAQMIYLAGLVHDVGKLAVPEQILSKPGALTPEEYRIMQGHVESSVAIIRNLPSLDYVLPAAVTHHERWDGKGYPRGLVGAESPIGGRCLALADAFDAMTSSRSYKPAYPVEYALQQIREGAGTQFDPELCPVFIRLVEQGTIRVEEAPTGAY